MKEFNTGFTEKSYFNIFKQIVVMLYNNNDKDGKLDFKYCDDEEINAYVCYDEKTMEDVLRVNTGTVIDVFAMMKTAFAQNNILPTFSDSSKEVNPVISGFFEKSDCSIRYNGTPIDDIRHTLADYASMFALRFIFTHELGHILNGHTQYLKKAYMNPRIDMRLKEEEGDSTYCLDRRTLEMDADAFAATTSIDNVIRLYYENKNDYIFSLLSKPEDVFVLWGFSVSCVFYKFESDMRTGYSKDGWYLPNEGRFIMVLSSALETIEAYAKHNVIRGLSEDREKIERFIAYGMSQARIFFKNVYNNDFCWVEKWYNDKYIYFSDEVLENWNNKLYYELTPYSRAMLYLPSKRDEIIERLT